jgi:transcriptional regulator with XRE-family HTH domain
MSFGARLAEERKRLGFKQAEFAALVGVDVPKQSLYENNRRELRAAYLARLAAARVDIDYVLTARRSEGALDEQATALLAAYFALPPELQQAVLRLLGDLGRQLA